MKLENETLIKKWEQLRLKAYKPTPNDVWTIGWGHTEGVRPHMTITRQQAQEYFESDIEWAERAVNQLVKVPLTQNQFDALVSFVFNVGRGAFASSTMLRKLNNKDYGGAANEFPRWNKQKGKVLRGLVRRRAEEMEVFLSDEVLDVKEEKGTLIDTPSKTKGDTKFWTALGAVLTGVGAALGGALPDFNFHLLVALCGALVGIGVALLLKHIKEKREG